MSGFSSSRITPLTVYGFSCALARVRWTSSRAGASAPAGQISSRVRRRENGIRAYLNAGFLFAGLYYPNNALVPSCVGVDVLHSAGIAHEST